MAISNIGITWGISGVHGWGIYGLNLARELLRRRVAMPMLLGGLTSSTLSDADRAQLEPLMAQIEQLRSDQNRAGGKKAHLNNTVLLHALGNGMAWSDLTEKFEGDVNIGVVFFEDVDKRKRTVARGNVFDAIIAGSSWNAQVLRDMGVENVYTVFQGIDPDRFHPADRPGRFDGKFVVFSGGKLEFRKGQDIALAAFREFNKRHPDSVLVTAWQNAWPSTIGPIDAAGLVKGVPNVSSDGQLRLVDWAVENGVPSESFVDLGLLPNQLIPQFLTDADVGLFLSRCEGGTNLAAMEAMACGVPCILSGNTGHLDLIDGDNCYPITKQGAIKTPNGQMDGWGESAVDDVVAALEEAYANRAETRRRGLRAASFMRDWAWQDQIEELVQTIEEIIEKSDGKA